MPTYIDGVFANFSINGVQKTLFTGQNYVADMGGGVQANLLLLQIVPGRNLTVTLQSCYSKTTATSHNVTSTVPTVPTTTTTVPAPVSSQSPLSIPPTLPAVGGLAITAAGASRLRRRMVRGRKQHMDLSPGIIKQVEEFGILEAVAFAAGVLFFVNNSVALAALVAFALGIMLTYSADLVRSHYGAPEYSYQRKSGVRKYFEEFGVAEIAIFAVGIWLFLNNYFIEGVLMAFLFGVALTFFVDRIREVRAIKSMETPPETPVEAPSASESEESQEGEEGPAHGDEAASEPDSEEEYVPKKRRGRPKTVRKPKGEDE